jgi:hypothetical protein
MPCPSPRKGAAPKTYLFPGAPFADAGSDGVDDPGEVGADDVSLEIVSGVLVGIGFSIDAETIERAATRAGEILWATSLERVGQLEIAVPVTA